MNMEDICPECGLDNVGGEWYTAGDGFEMCDACYDSYQGRWEPVREDTREEEFYRRGLTVVDYPEDWNLS